MEAYLCFVGTQSREGDTWGLIGGNIDSGVDSIQAVVREAREEIGYTIQPDDLIFVKSYKWEHSDAHILFDVFRYKTDRKEIVIALGTEENTEYLWATPDTLSQRNDLMKGLYPILKDLYGAQLTQ
jgi:8-oxo-dGTP pyrophosphatase MutT (NUDIX family)